MTIYSEKKSSGLKMVLLNGKECNFWITGGPYLEIGNTYFLTARDDDGKKVRIHYVTNGFFGQIDLIRPYFVDYIVAADDNFFDIELLGAKFEWITDGGAGKG